MEISIKRDGLTLRGDLLRPHDGDCPVAILFHGLMANRKADMFPLITDALIKKGIAVVKFDFNGHGESDGKFSDMNVYSEILDAAKIMDYVRALPWATDIYIAGHSQGGLVGSMIAGYYRDYVKKLALMAPAATIKDDAQTGSLFGTYYDARTIPETFPMKNLSGETFELSNTYIRLAKTLPIYDTASRFEGKTLIIHGTADAAVRVSGSLKYKDCMKDVEVELIEGEEHGLSKFSLPHVVERIADFFSED